MALFVPNIAKFPTLFWPLILSYPSRGSLISAKVVN